MGTRIPGVPGPPPGGTIGIVIAAPPAQGQAADCTCKDVVVHWALPDDADASATASTIACPAVLSADGTICPSTTWTFDLAWDGDEADIPTVVQVGASSWKIVGTAAGTVIVTPRMLCGTLTIFPVMTNVISAGGGGGGGVAEWQNLKDIATVVANPDLHGEGSAYDSGTGIYSTSQGTGDYGDYGTFDITVGVENLPICCRVVLLSGDFGSTNIDTVIFENTGFSRGFYLRFNVGGTTFNENFSIHTDDGQIRLQFNYVHGGDYTPNTFRIDYIATDS